MKKHKYNTCKTQLSSVYGKMVSDVVDTPFMAMDFCCICGGYDTIQTYIQLDKKWVHVCEKCLKEIFTKYTK